MESKFKKIWEELLRSKNLPSKLTGVIEINYKDFKLLRDKFDLKKSEKLIQELHAGKVLIIKNAFDKDLVDYIKKQVMQFWKDNPDTYFEMVENCPDFHRVITPDVAKNYSVGAVRHTTYFSMEQRSL